MTNLPLRCIRVCQLTRYVRCHSHTQMIPALLQPGRICGKLFQELVSSRVVFIMPDDTRATPVSQNAIVSTTNGAHISDLWRPLKGVIECWTRCTLAWDIFYSSSKHFPTMVFEDALDLDSDTDTMCAFAAGIKCLREHATIIRDLFAQRRVEIFGPTDSQACYTNGPRTERKVLVSPPGSFLFT